VILQFHHGDFLISPGSFFNFTRVILKFRQVKALSWSNSNQS